MKKAIIICIAVLCIVTVNGCQKPHTTGGPDTTATAKIAVQTGCFVNEWDEGTGGAVQLREWLNGFETEPAESVPEDDCLRYEIELTFGRSEPECYVYLDFGDECYLRSGGEWVSVGNPSPIPVGYAGNMAAYVGDIIKVEYLHNAEITELELSEKDKTALSEWLCGLKYERRRFPAGETPGDSDGGEVWAFTFKTGRLSYVDNGESECYLLFDGEWYAVDNPSKMPFGA